jgi:hypothetical protein
MRAANRQPSDIGIQQFSISRTIRGKRWTIFIEDRSHIISSGGVKMCRQAAGF